MTLGEKSALLLCAAAASTLLAHGSARADGLPSEKVAQIADMSAILKRARSLELAADKQSYCGSAPSYQYVRDYDGSLGQSIDFVNAHKNPVGRLDASHKCSGTLIARNLFLTAGHCSIEVSPGTSRVTFNAEYEAGTQQLAATTSYTVSAVVEQNLGNLDYGILQIADNPGSSQPNPGDAFGIAIIDRFVPAKAHLITIIQHAEGLPKRVEVGHVRSNDNDLVTYDDLDTASGSSGSGILDDDGKLIGVHTDGECQNADPSARYNYGVLMASIYKVSPTIRSLAPPELLARYDNVASIGIQEVGATYGDDTDTVPAEAWLLLRNAHGGYTLPLRSGTDEAANVGMLTLLRKAFVEDAVLRVEYTRTTHRNNLILRVIRR